MENEVDYFNETLIILKSKHFIQPTLKTMLEYNRGLMVRQKAFCKFHSLSFKRSDVPPFSLL